MKVLHVFKDYFPPTRGGIEQHIHEVVHSLDGFEFAVLTSSRSRHKVAEDDAGVRVVRAPEYARPASTPITPSWPKLIREAGADLLHFHMPNPFGELAYLTSKAPGPMVATYHAEIIGRRLLLPFFAPFQQSFLRRARRIIVSNPKTLETSEALTDHHERAVVIPFGVDPDDWESRPPLADELRERYPGRLLLFLGRLVYYKGVEILADAMQRVDATLILVGDGPRRAEFEAAANRFRVRRKVVFVGEVGDWERAAYYHAADVFVLPSTSRAEGFGIGMLQAMACGTPVVSTELGTGTSWVNLDGQTGLVVPPGDAPALAGAIKSLLSDEGRRRAIGEAAARRVRERFTKQGMLEGIASVYASL